jgi:hypothetical protein
LFWHSPGRRDQIMEIATNAKLFKNIWLVFDFPRNVVIVDR